MLSNLTYILLFLVPTALLAYEDNKKGEVKVAHLFYAAIYFLAIGILYGFFPTGSLIMIGLIAAILIGFAITKYLGYGDIALTLFAFVCLPVAIVGYILALALGINLARQTARNRLTDEKIAKDFDREWKKAMGYPIEITSTYTPFIPNLFLASILLAIIYFIIGVI